MKGKIGCAVIGVGKWGNLISRQVPCVESLALLGVADLSYERAQVVAREMGVPAYASIEQALADENVRAVAIAVPNYMHVQVALAALEAGKHVLLEKPMALTVADAEAIDRKAREARRVLMLDHIQRFFAPQAEFKQLADSGVLGKLQAMFVMRRDWLKRTIPWLKQREFVGGLHYQSTIHDFDTARSVLGNAVEIYCSASPDVIAPEGLDFPDLILSQLRFESGAVAQIWTSMTDPLMGYKGYVSGTEGSASFDLYDAKVSWQKFGGQPTVKTWEPADRWAPFAWMASGGMAEGEAEGLRGVLGDFALAIEGVKPPAVTGEDGIRSVELAQAGYLSLVEHRPVTLPLPESQKARKTYLEL